MEGEEMVVRRELESMDDGWNCEVCSLRKEAWSDPVKQQTQRLYTLYGPRRTDARSRSAHVAERPYDTCSSLFRSTSARQQDVKKAYNSDLQQDSGYG